MSDIRWNLRSIKGEDKKSITSGPSSRILLEMPGKLAKNKEIREGQRAHAVKVLSSVNEVLSEYDGSRGAKDNITRLSIALNEKLVTLKALDESILCAVDDGEIEREIEESENIRAQIHEALVINYRVVKSLTISRKMYRGRKLTRSQNRVEISLSRRS